MLHTTLLVLGLLSSAVWIHLVFFRGGFWRADQRLPRTTTDPAEWPAVVAVVPARNEADVIARSIGSLLAQDYPGTFKIVLVDDHSDDNTGAVARGLPDPQGRLTVLEAKPLPEGWSGKLWAVSQGVDHASQVAPAAKYVWLTDADIGHPHDLLRRLVAKGEADRLDLVSLMVKLACVTRWERLLIPAFVFFFQKLYPFSKVNDHEDSTYGAAGGCMLIRRARLAHVGGIESVGGALIDDCTLGRILKQDGGRVWLGLGEQSASLRPYPGLGGIWSMVSRSAFDQLDYSLPNLIGTVLGMAIIYMTPPIFALWGPLLQEWITMSIGIVLWVTMAVVYKPTASLYGQGYIHGLMLPVIGAFYTAMTVDSAIRHWRGKGGAWKGRFHSPAAKV